MFFYSCNIPFKRVEDKYFLKFVETLNKCSFSYKPPCRQTLGGSVLNKVYEDITREKKKLLQDTDSVLLVDGWKNKPKNRKYLTFSLCNIHTPQTFLSYKDTSKETEDGESLAVHINDAVKFAKQEFQTNVFAIITDNDSKIKKGARLSESADGTNIWQTTCSSHSGNLLIKTIAEEDDSLKYLRDVIHTFRDPKLESLLIELGGTKLQNYPDTRFCYFRDSCESVLKNIPYLQKIILTKDVNIPNLVSQLIFDENFIQSLKNIIIVLNPICVLINKCQDPKCNVADAVQYWLSIFEKLPTNKYDEKIRARIKKALWPVGYAANILHHKYNGILLNDEQKRVGFEFIKENLDIEGKTQLDYFFENPEEFSYYAEH